MREEEKIKNIIEIIELSRDEIKNNDKNVSAILDLEDLKSLQDLLELYTKEKSNTNKLIRYIALKENKDYEQIKEEFEI